MINFVHAKAFRNLLMGIMITGSLAATAEARHPAGSDHFPRFRISNTKVILVVLENDDLNNALKEPFLSSLESKFKGVVLYTYQGTAHPSEPNYISMISGTLDYRDMPGAWVGGDPGVYVDVPDKPGHPGKRVNVVIDDDEKYDLPGKHLGDLFEANHLTWKNYAEDYPGTKDKCFQERDDKKGNPKGKYVRRHVPFMSFMNVTGANTPKEDDSRCREHIVNASAFEADVMSGNLPSFSYYSPNIDHDGHETSVGAASKWLGDTIGKHLGKPEFKDVLLIVTFDENSCNTVGSDGPDGDNEKVERCRNDNNVIYTAFVGKDVRQDLERKPKLDKNGKPQLDDQKRPMLVHVDANKNPVPGVDEHYDHFNLLHTIESAFELGDLGRNDVKEVKKFFFNEDTQKIGVKKGSGKLTEPITGIWVQ